MSVHSLILGSARKSAGQRMLDDEYCQRQRNRTDQVPPSHRGMMNVRKFITLGGAFINKQKHKHGEDKDPRVLSPHPQPQPPPPPCLTRRRKGGGGGLVSLIFVRSTAPLSVDDAWCWWFYKKDHRTCDCVDSGYFWR